MNNLDLSTLSIDDIIEEYKILQERHKQLKEQSEEDAQRIHELKRSLDTSLAAERYLTLELEQISAQAQAVACPGVEPRVQQELEELRRKLSCLQLEQESLQQDYDAKAEETLLLKAKLESILRDQESNAMLKANSSQDERLTNLELENAELMQKLDDYEDAKVQNTFALAEQEKTIEILKDQVSCLEENMRFKRNDLEEKVQLLESAQEQLVDANAKIALLTSAPEHNDRKGNSLFAEVDDQRQVMKHLLASQKKSYLDMKKIFNESKFEIHRLKRENIAMHTELQACSTIFCSADKTYHNKLNDRIRQLMQQNAKLERNLNVSQERLRELASQKSVTWLDSMLDFCKRETDELKVQLHSMHIQKATLDAQMRNVQQEMARWRFESLKSRCVLIDRENLLMEHKIAFKPIQALEFDIKEAQLQAALPRIVSVTSTSSPAVTESSRSVTAQAEIIVLDTPLKAPAVCVKLQSDVIVLDTPPKAELQGEIKCETRLELVNLKREVQEREVQEPKEHTDAQQEQLQLQIKNEPEQLQIECKVEPEEVQLPCKIEPEAAEIMEQPIEKQMQIKVKSDEQLLSPQAQQMQAVEKLVPAKPQRKGTPIKLKQIKAEYVEEDTQEQTADEPKEDSFEIAPVMEAKPLRKGTPVRAKASTETTNCQLRSILTKRRDLFAEDTHKNVKFSSSEPIVHNLSPDPCSKENEPPVGQDIKPPKKSQNIIRRIVVASKKPASS